MPLISPIVIVCHLCVKEASGVSLAFFSEAGKVEFCSAFDDGVAKEGCSVEPDGLADEASELECCIVNVGWDRRSGG
jgi:hypothetical protein